MNVTNKLPGVSKRPTLPVSIPIHIYRKTLQKASANSGSKNISKQEITKPIEHIKRKENMPKLNDKRENQPRQASNMVKENEKSTDKSTITDPPSAFNESPAINAQNGDFVNYLFFMFYNNFISYLRPKPTENKSTQTDLFLSDEDKANTEKFKDKSKDTQPNILKDVENFSQEYKNFYIEFYESTKKLFEQNVVNNQRQFKYSEATRRLLMNIFKNIIDLITREETEDISSGASIAAEVINIEIENDKRNSSETITPPVVSKNNNKEVSNAKNQTAPNVTRHDLREVQEDIQREQLNIEQSYIQEYEPSPQTLQASQTANTYTPYEYHPQSNLLNTPLHNNNMTFNPQSASRYTRPQMLEQQLLNNKMYRYKSNVRPIQIHPYIQKPQKRKPGQPQDEKTQPFHQQYLQNQCPQQQYPQQQYPQQQHPHQQYYPVNQQQFIQQPTYQQNLH